MKNEINIGDRYVYSLQHCHRFYIIILCMVSLIYAEHPDTTLMKIDEQKANIEYAAKMFNVNPDYLKAIIYVERTNNYNWQDEYFDDYLAKKGQNSSIGFCQVKMKTAYWIECQLADISSEFYCGERFSNILPISSSAQNIIDKLNDEQTNLLYAAAYMRIIQSYWGKAGFPIDDRVDIIATIFSYGMFSRETGEPLKPHGEPKANCFGSEAYRFSRDKSQNPRDK
jgi:hypothetical protein